ncbi:serine dehydratase-like isoform X2 [Callithrix jacchus]
MVLGTLRGESGFCCQRSRAGHSASQGAHLRCPSLGTRDWAVECHPGGLWGKTSGTREVDSIGGLTSTQRCDRLATWSPEWTGLWWNVPSRSPSTWSRLCWRAGHCPRWQECLSSSSMRMCSPAAPSRFGALGIFARRWPRRDADTWCAPQARWLNACNPSTLGGSGGNAGIAAAYAAGKLGIPATIVLPENTSLQVVQRLQGEGAKVQLTGKVWDEANLRAQELAKRDGWVNVPPFDHPLICVAKCLGAKTVAARALECTRVCEIHSEVVEDAEAVSAVQQFLDDERVLVEPACGAALAAIYSGLLRRLQAEGCLPPSLTSVVVIVCGGNNINSQELQALKTQLGQV